MSNDKVRLSQITEGPERENEIARRLKQYKNPPRETLWQAFVAAQSEFGAIVKDTMGARGKYAPLDAVLDALRPVLSRHGLALSQPTQIIDDALIVQTLLVHRDTGEQHLCEYPAGPLTLQHQQLGAGVTYARRYSLLSLLGVAPENEDDDGEKAGAAGAPPPEPRLNASQAKKQGLWGAFTARLESFKDLDALETWWADGSTQAKIDQMPPAWQDQAAEAYEKKQEALMSAGGP